MKIYLASAFEGGWKKIQQKEHCNSLLSFWSILIYNKGDKKFDVKKYIQRRYLDENKSAAIY